MCAINVVQIATLVVVVMLTGIMIWLDAKNLRESRERTQVLKRKVDEALIDLEELELAIIFQGETLKHLGEIPGETEGQ